MFSRLYYVVVSSFVPNKKVMGKWKDAEQAYKNGRFYLIRRNYLEHRVNPPQFKMLSAIRDAVEYTKRWRFVYEANDRWSAMFV